MKLKKTMKQVKSLKVNTVLNIIKTCAGIVFPLVTYPYISRVLLPDNVGKISFGTSYVSYFSLIASLGISTYAIRECSKVRDKKNKLNDTASQIFSINVCTTMAAYVLLALSLILFRNVDSYRILIIIQSTVILFTTLGADWINTAMEDFKYITTRTVAFQILSLVLMFLFVKTPDDYINYAIITVMSTSGSNLLNFFYRRRYCKIKFTFNIQWKLHFIPILFLFVMVLSQTIFNSADITMLGLYKDDYEVGIYSTAYKIVNIISQMVSSVLMVLIPRLSYLFADNNFVHINTLLRKVLNVFLTLGIPCFAGAFIMAKEIVLIIGGENYIEATTALQILLISFLFSLIGGNFLGNIVLLPSGREKLYMIICCISTLVNIVLNFILIPIYGVNAAAATTAFSSLLILIMLLFTKDKQIHIEQISILFLNPVTGSVLLSVYCVIIKNCSLCLGLRTALCIGGSIVIYITSQILMKNDIVIEILHNFNNKLRSILK